MRGFLIKYFKIFSTDNVKLRAHVSLECEEVLI